MPAAELRTHMHHRKTNVLLMVQLEEVSGHVRQGTAGILVLRHKLTFLI